MPKIDLYTISGTKSGQIELPKEIFAAKINPPLMAQAVRVYLSNQRVGLAKAQTRSEVNRTKAKWFKQKGTGHARHGARSAPIFVGGGKAHGPNGEQNYHLKMSKAMKKKALFSALSAKLKEGKILVVKDLAKVEPKTTKVAKMLENLKFKKEILLVLPQKLENVFRAARNMAQINLAQADLLNTYEVLNGGQILLMAESIERLEEVFLGKKTKKNREIK